MKRIAFCLFLVHSFSIALAQHSEQQMIEDSVIGWYTKLTPADRPLKPLPIEGHTFSIRQQEINNLFVQWMQQTYTPVGGIGTYKKRYYVKKDEFFPHAYGVEFLAYSAWLNVRDKQGNLKPVPETWTPFYVVANALFGINPAYYLNTPSQYVFAMLPDGYMDSDFWVRRFKDADPKVHPRVHKYLTTVTSSGMTVYLTPGNKLPIRQLTKGEFIQRSDESFEGYLQNKTKEITRQYSNEKSRNEAIASEQEKVKQYREKLKGLRDQYASRLNEPAVIRDMQPTIYTIINSPDPFKLDPFGKNLKHEYGVYTYEPAVYEKAKTDQPQWIAIHFPYATSELGRKEYELYRAITEHFNFDYVYDYFFNPEKVRGQAYRPVNEELLKTTLANYSKRTYWNNPASVGATLPAGVLFLDDFKVNENGARPAGWFFSSFGKASKVTTITGLPGKWMQLGANNKVDPTSLKKPLPENFTLEYDVATSPDFTARTGGSVRLYLSGGMKGDPKKASTEIKVEITSGNEANFSSNYRGQVKFDVVSIPLVKPTTHTNNGPGQVIVPLKTFTDRKTTVHVTLRKRSSDITLLINDKPILSSADFKSVYGYPCEYCIVPAGVQFNTIYWENITNEGENVNVYISNVKLSKE
ncbi:hypothetical protein [Spirosoma sp. KNUC1025]|uniref:hypothetical protein n=1 Tax=Spirosoma sp. KNUC1025 TaxID=2894082 RepID=UPI0038632721|nr:hypothetical protein LN737_12545 [Spirosoma sp. KNUC1025]